MSGTHKYPTISFRISPREREEIEAKIFTSGMKKKDYFVRSKYAAWKNPELKLTSLKHAIENDQAVVRAEYDMKSIGGTLSLTYTINNKG